MDGRQDCQEPEGAGGPAGVAAQLDLALLGVVVDALPGLLPVDVVFQLLAVRRLVGRTVLDLLGLDRDLVGEARAEPKDREKKLGHYQLAFKSSWQA